MACKSMGLIKDLAKFDSEKAKKCKKCFFQPYSHYCLRLEQGFPYRSSS